jgi:hypothetical protein
MSKHTDFWQQFSHALSKQGEKRPEGKGWRTFAEWLEASKQHASSTSRALSRGVKGGLLERFEGQVFKGSGLERCVWYRNRPTP